MIDFDSKASPLIEYFESLGYKADGNNGSSVFTKYSTVEEELNSLYNGVGVRDISNYGILELRGNDVRDFLHRITTNSIKELPKERAVQTILTTDKGRIIDVITLLNFGEYKFVITNPANKFKVKSWIEKYVIMDDVKVSDINKKYVLLEILGPQAVAFATLFVGNIQNEIDFNQFKVIHSDGVLFFILKLADYKGNPKFWILAETQNGMKLVKSMKEYTGPFGFSFIGNEAYEIYRIEHGIPAAPNELNGSFNPYEVDLIKLVDFKKGCYIGQEVIARLETYDKVQKLLVGIEFLESPLPESHYVLLDENNKEAGTITSYVNSLKLKKFIGLGYVRKNYLEGGTILIAKDQFHRTIRVEIKSLPFKK